MNFKLLSSDDTTGCAGGKCPSIYIGDDGAIYVKGYVVGSGDKTALDPNSDEDVVRIPLSVLKAAAKDV